MLLAPITFRSKNGKEFILRSPRDEEAQICLDMMVKIATHSPYILTTSEDFQKKTLEGQVTWFQESAASDSSILITVFHQQQMIGFCNGRSYKDVKRKHRAALGITLLPDFRGCGLGMKMMEVLIESMKKFSNIKIIELDVMTNNTPALKMYEKLGFKSAGIFPNAFILPTGEVSDNMTMYLEV